MALPPPTRAPPPRPQAANLPLATAASLANTTTTAAASTPPRMLTRSNTIRLVTDDEEAEAWTAAENKEEPKDEENDEPSIQIDEKEFDEKEKPANTQRLSEDSRRGRSSPQGLPLTMLAYLQDTSDHPAHPSFAASAALLDSDAKDHREFTKNTKNDRPSLTHRSSSTVTMTTPAGPVAVASPDRICTTSPLSHLRQTLVQSYSTTDVGGIKIATTAATAATRQSPTKKNKTKALPTRSPSYSTMPPSTRRLTQQTTEDFVMRTSRSVARDQAHQPPTSHSPQQQQTHTHTQNQKQPRPSRQTSQPRSSHAPQKQNLPAYYTGSNGVQHHWQRPAPIKTRTASVPQPDNKNIILRKKAAPGVLFAALPGEVIELVLDELKKLHYSDFAPTHNKSDVYIGEHSSCATCWMRDACSMALTARKMLKYARVALYEAIEIVGADNIQEAHHHHFYSHRKPSLPPAAAGSARLTLLLRTLRDSPQMAAMVRSIKVPSLALYQSVPGVPTIGASGAIPDSYETLVASLIMSCPNLERVLGFHPTYDHVLHSRYFQALSTRPRLKEMTWIVEPIFTKEQHDEMRQQARRREDQALNKSSHKLHKSRRSRSRSISAIIRPHSLPSPPASPPLGSVDTEAVPAPPTPSLELNPRQSARFLNHHVNWHYLSTLTVHCKEGGTLAHHPGLLTECLSLLPRLKNLYLSHLPAGAFDDTALLSLPASLRKLSLVHLQGVTSDGLSNFATRPNSKHLTSLSLVHVDNLAGAGGLPALARTLLKLAELKSLTLVQSQPPTLAAGETVWLFPYLASSSLTHLHWDIPSSVSASNSADAILARSIAASGFPSLKTLRAPADPEGLFQSLCRPQERVDLPADRRRSLVAGGNHYYPGYTAPAAFTSAPSGSSSPPPAHAHRHSDSSSTSSASVFSASLAHSRTNSSSLSSNFGNATGNGHVSGKPPGAVSQEAMKTRLHTNLHHARIAAQMRIDASRRTPRFFVNVTDEHGTMVDKFGMGGFIGTVGSPIVYHLQADPDASDNKGGFVDIDDFLADGGEVLGGNDKDKDKEGDTFKAARVCSGQWNADWDAPQKKDRERWHHTERGRWRGVSLF